MAWAQAVAGSCAGFFNADALEPTKPRPEFVLCVLAALPAMTFPAQAVTVGSIAAKGGSTAAGTGSISWLGAALAPLLAFLNLFGIWRLSHLEAHSDRERPIYKTLYPLLATSIVAVIVLNSLVREHSGSFIQASPVLFVG